MVSYPTSIITWFLAGAFVSILVENFVVPSAEPGSTVGNHYGFDQASTDNVTAIGKDEPVASDLETSPNSLSVEVPDRILNNVSLQVLDPVSCTLTTEAMRALQITDSERQSVDEMMASAIARVKEIEEGVSEFVPLAEGGGYYRISPYKDVIAHVKQAMGEAAEETLGEVRGNALSYYLTKDLCHFGNFEQRLFVEQDTDGSFVIRIDHLDGHSLVGRYSRNVGKAVAGIGGIGRWEHLLMKK